MKGGEIMKKCKYCQSEIDAKAKICPNCRKKQGSKIGKCIFWGLIALFIISIAFGGDGNDDFQKDYNQSDAVTFNDIKYTITKVEKTKGSNEFFQAKEGYEYVKVTLKPEGDQETLPEEDPPLTPPQWRGIISSRVRTYVSAPFCISECRDKACLVRVRRRP